jgi:hypothetical protein
LCGMLVVGRCCRLRSVSFSADAVSVATMSDTVQNQIVHSSWLCKYNVHVAGPAEEFLVLIPHELYTIIHDFATRLHQRG